MIKTIILYFAILYSLCFMTHVYAQTPVPDPAVKTGQLANGLRYYLRHNEQTKGYADFHLIQAVGSAQQEEHERGLAHFLEHMAFNGTKHFPGNTLVSTLEQRGIRFGRNINAATGYDHTIYRLTDIPVQNTGLLDTILLVLLDWSAYINCEDQEIEEERGVIQEEWRTRSVASLRVLDTAIFPKLYAGSPYADRIPIGKMDVVMNFQPQVLRDFFHKWYRPDLQTIVVVGDLDMDELEQELITRFSSIPKRNDSAPLKDTRIPDNEKPIVAVATDPELQDIMVNIYWKLPEATAAEKGTVEYVRNGIVQRAIANLLANRFWKITEREKQLYNTPTVMVGNYAGLGNRYSFSISSRPRTRDNLDVTEVIKQLLLEAERFKRYGLTETELEEHRKDMLQYLDRQTVSNSQEKGNYEQGYRMVQSLTRGELILDPDWENNFRKQVYADLTVDMLNAEIQRMLDTVNMAFAITGPQKDRALLPDAAGIGRILQEVHQAALDPYVYTKKEEKSLPAVTRKKGKVTRSRERPFGFVEWTLSNGAKVQYRRTDNKDDYHYIWAHSPGGMSVISMEDLPSALAMNGIINQEAPKIPEAKNEAIEFKVDTHMETLGGRTRHIRLFLQLLHARMTGIEKIPHVFERYMDGKRRALQSWVDPKRIYQDTLNSLMRNNNPRSMLTLEDPKVLSQVDYDRILRLYRERFGNAGDFTFFITGPSPVDSMKLWVEQYIGSLPYSAKREQMLDHQSYPPKGITKKHFSVPMGIPQSTVTIGYTGMMPMNVYNQMMMEYLTGVLRLVYTEKMREQEAGTYGVGVSGTIYNFPKGYFIFQLGFDTAPEMKEKLMGIAYQEIERVLREGPEERYVQKVKESLISSHRQQLGAPRNAEYWIDKAWMLDLYGLDGRINYEELARGVTPASIRTFAEQVLGSGNRIEVVMNPK